MDTGTRQPHGTQRHKYADNTQYNTTTNNNNSTNNTPRKHRPTPTTHQHPILHVRWSRENNQCQENYAERGNALFRCAVRGQSPRRPPNRPHERHIGDFSLTTTVRGRDESLRENTAPLTVFMGLVVSLKPPSFHRVRGWVVSAKPPVVTEFFQNHVDGKVCTIDAAVIAHVFRAWLRGCCFHDCPVSDSHLSVSGCCLRCTRKIGFFCEMSSGNCFRIRRDAWFDSGYMFIRRSTEASWIISIFFNVKEDSDPGVVSRPGQ